MGRPKGIKKYNHNNGRTVANTDFLAMFLKPGAEPFYDKLFTAKAKCFNNPFLYTDYNGYGAFEDEDGRAIYRQLTVDECEELCYGCPLIKECYEFAVANEEQHGIWGGVNFGVNEDDLFNIEEEIN